MAATFPVPLRTGGVSPEEAKQRDKVTTEYYMASLMKCPEYVLIRLSRALEIAEGRRQARQVAVAIRVAISLAGLTVFAIFVAAWTARGQRNHLSGDIPPEERLRISDHGASNIHSTSDSMPNLSAAQVIQTSIAADFAPIEIPAASGPAQVCAGVVNLLVQAARQLGRSPLLSALEVQPGSYFCRRFPTTHTNTSQGYLLYSQRRKLKAELLGKSQEEIRELRLAGEDVTDTISVPEIAFTGDTSAEFLDGLLDPALEDALKARVLVTEMTFVSNDVTVDEAREKGHMHIADFVAHAPKFQNEAIVLIHFSPRYKRTDIIAALNSMLPPSLRAKCVPLLNGIE
ncbi:hypothetical protein Vafri_17683 [Volvox africanus]|uniref:Metallo-beta-lactamase domain-containing protein n=1 Tax=Volvox africanus TaxID=51714 RepID=A0A8J4F7X2_9CHLO|nr:hypothetical protein Vafri_17683 [Volvox africanus]